MNKLTERTVLAKTDQALVIPVSKAIKSVNGKSPKKVVIVALIAALCVAVGIFGVPKIVAATGSAYFITADGRQVVVVNSQDDAYEAIDLYLTQEGEQVAAEVITAEALDLVAVDRADCQPVSVEEAAAVLEQNLTPLVHGAVIEINGQTKMFVASEQEAEQLLEEAKAHYIDDTTKVLDVKVREEVSVKSADLPAERLTEHQKALNMLVFGSSQSLVHQVESSDETLWTIAAQYSLDMHDLKVMNPGLTSNDLRVGSEVRLSDVTPLLTVAVVKKSVRTAPLAYNVDTQNDSSLDRGTTKVLSAGKNGLEEATWQVVEENGRQVSETKLSAKTLTAPVDEVVARGTRMTVASRGSGSTGTLSWPLSNKLNSYFGNRSLGYHTGIDIDGETGDTYVAADAGTVIFAGWNGSYGNMVKVDHGGGLETWYAHSSALSVSVGQSVGKGQKLGEVGSTGRSTGSHLHFEVRIDGNAYDPLNYLP